MKMFTLPLLKSDMKMFLVAMGVKAAYGAPALANKTKYFKCPNIIRVENK